MWIADAPTSAQPTAGCRWPVISHCDVDPTSLPTEDLIDWTLQAAIEILWKATGRRYGICTVTERPCADCEPGEPLNMWHLLGQRRVETSLAATVLGWCSRCRSTNCSCTTVESVVLKHRPVRQVLEVRVDGVVLGPSLYRRAGNELIRLPGAPVVVDDWDQADVVDGVSAALSDVTVTGPVADGGAVLGLAAGTHTIGFGGARIDPVVTLLLAADATVDVPATVVAVTGDATLDGGVVTAAADGLVTLHIAQATSSIEITVTETGWLVAVQWSDLTVANPGWPKCQDRNVAAGQPGSWTVRYDHGRHVPVGGQLAAGRYACELAKAFSADADCELPRRIQTKIVDDQTIGFIDPQTYIEQGGVGLEQVDAWIRSVNPKKLARRAQAYRADDPRRRRRR